MNHPRLALVAARFTATLLVAGLLPSQGTLKRGVYEDPGNGFKVRVPAGWTQLPMRADEEWIVAKFQSNREYEGHHKLDDSQLHRPLMRVILFDHERIKESYESVKKESATEAALRKLPYRDYRDYCQRNLPKGGWSVSQEEKGREGDLQVTRFQLKVKGEKARLRYVCWVFHGDLADLAVEFEFLEQHIQKLEPEASVPLRSFRFIPRVEDATARGEGDALRSELDRKEWQALPLEERFKRRRMVEMRRAKKAIDSLPEGWTVQETQSLYVLSHAHKKYRARITAAAEACRSWLNRRFGRVNDEYSMKGILRICKDKDEYETLRKDSKDAFSVVDGEVHTYEDRDEGNAGLNFGPMFHGLFEQYIHDRDSYLQACLPVWMHVALREYFETAILKGKKMVFRPDDDEREAFHELRRKDGIKSAKELMTMTWEDYKAAKNADLYIDEQFVNLLRFLEGPGKRRKPLKGSDFVLDYMKGSVLALVKYWEENPGETPEALREADKVAKDEKKDEAERKAAAEKRSKAEGKRRTATLKMVNARLCNWSEAEWDSLNKAYARFCR